MDRGKFFSPGVAPEAATAVVTRVVTRRIPIEDDG
jgi:hypothetical protein